MKKPKFSLLEDVWVMNSSLPKPGYVTGIIVAYSTGTGVNRRPESFKYYVESDEAFNPIPHGTLFDEGYIFLTRRDLIESL